MSVRLLGTTLIFGFMLSACSQPDQHSPATSVAEVAVSRPVADAIPVAVTQSNTVHYACRPSQDITVTYSAQDATQPKATVVIDDIAYEMYAVVAASGARYATEQGIHPEQGMQWHTKGDSAMLMSMALDHTVSSEDEHMLFSCTEKVPLEPIEG